MKRFSDTLRFAEPWYYELPIEMKMAWEFIWANCDNAGVWNPNTKLAEIQIGKKVDWKTMLSRCEGKIVKLENGRWYLPEFVSFQCGVLSENCRPHAVVIGLLRNHGLMEKDSLSIVYPYSTGRVLEQDKDKEKDQDKEKDKDQDTPPRISKDRGTLDEIKAFAVELGMPESDGEACFHKWDGNGWTNGGAKIKDWRATVRSWKASGYLPSQKPVNPQRNGAKPNVAHDQKSQWGI